MYRYWLDVIWITDGLISPDDVESGGLGIYGAFRQVCVSLSLCGCACMDVYVCTCVCMSVCVL